MAWQWKLTDVTYESVGEDGEGNPMTQDVSKNGRFQITYEVYDDAAALVDTRSLALPYDVDQQATIDTINIDVARMRDARARVAALIPAIGFVQDVP